MPNGQIKEKVVVEPHPGGAKGAMMSLDKVAEKMWASRNDPRIRAWTTQQLAKAGNPTGAREKMQVVLDAYRAKVPYVSDPVQTEFMAGPVQTLCLDDHGLCIVGGDCDDATITVGACLLSIGIPVQVVGASYKEPTTQPTHVYLQAQDDAGEWVPMDATTKFDVGNVHEPARTWIVEPNKGVGAAGLQGGDFVGVGRPPLRPAPWWYRPPVGVGAPAVLAPPPSWYRGPPPVPARGLTPSSPPVIETQDKDWQNSQIPSCGVRIRGTEWGALSRNGQQITQGLGVWSDDIDRDIAELDPSMVALNTAVTVCGSTPNAQGTPSLAVTDIALWEQAYLRWEKVKSDWAFDKQGSIAPGPVYGTGIEARIQLSRNDYVTFQNKVAKACPGLAPPIISPIQSQPGGDWVDDIKHAGQVIVGVAVAGVVVYGVYKAVEIASSFAKKK